VSSVHVDGEQVDLLSGLRLLQSYVSSKSLVCRAHLFLGVAQSRTISSMVLPDLMLFGKRGDLPS